MKKTTLVSIASFLFLLLASSVAYFTKEIFFNAITAFIVGISILALSGAIAFFVKERVEINVICFFISSLAMGVLIRSWYIFRAIENTIPTMIIVSLSLVLYLWIFFAISKISIFHNSKGAYVALIVIYAIISIALYVFVILKTETSYISTFGYYMAIELAFIFAMSLDTENPDELIRNLTLSTYSIFIVVIIAAVVVAVIAGGDGECDCDCGPEGCECCCEGLDCFDGCNCGGERTVQKAKKKK